MNEAGMLYYPVGSAETVGRRGRIRCTGWCMIKDSTRNGRIIPVFLLGIKKAGLIEGEIVGVFVGKWMSCALEWIPSVEGVWGGISCVVA